MKRVRLIVQETWDCGWWVVIHESPERLPIRLIHSADGYPTRRQGWQAGRKALRDWAIQTEVRLSPLVGNRTASAAYGYMAEDYRVVGDPATRKQVA